MHKNFSDVSWRILLCGICRLWDEAADCREHRLSSRVRRRGQLILAEARTGLFWEDNRNINGGRESRKDFLRARRKRAKLYRGIRKTRNVF